MESCGDTIVLYTDGILEYTRLGHDDALDTELARLAGSPAGMITEALQTLVERSRRAHLDDVAVLAISRTN